MNRSLLLTAILAVIVSPHGVVAQALANLPVLRPKVTELGGFRDTTALRDLVPDEAVPSPRGTLIAYTTSNDLRLWNVSTRSSRIVIDGWSESVAWSPNGDAIAFAHAQ